MKTQPACLFIVALMLAMQSARAQLVSDGQTSVLDGLSTNVTGGITIGTNASFTFLELTNGATVTNTGSGYIGLGAAAKSNSVIVTGAGSVWSAGINFYVGQSGAFNQLSVLNGAIVTGNSATIGQNNSSSNNLALVSDPGSLWSNTSALYVGDGAAGNQLVVSNGGTVLSVGATIGNVGSALPTRNRVTVTGTGSVWRCSSFLNVGNANTLGANQLVISNGATVEAGSGLCTIGTYSPSNSILVTGPGTLFTNSSDLVVGYNGNDNQLIVSNGAVTSAANTSVENNGGYQQKVTVTGAGSLLTNRTDFYLGRSGASNQLVVARGGMLADNAGYVGYPIFNPGANQALITDSNSVWTNRSDLNIGYGCPGNHLVVSNGARVFNNFGYMGNQFYSSNNVVLITDPGSMWSNRADLYIGNSGPSNQLVICNTSIVSAKDLFLGANNSSSNNLLTIGGGNLIITNFNVGGLNVRGGTVVLNSGLVRADVLFMNSGARGKMSFNGGKLQALSVFVANSSPFIAGNGSDPATYEMLQQNGTHNFANGLIISSNAALIGVGTVVGNIYVARGGTISPGTNNTVSFITINNGGLTLSNGSTTRIKLHASLHSATHFDNLTNVTYGGTLQLTNISGSLGDGNSFILFNAAHYAGAFDSITPTIPGPGLRWNTNQLTVDGTLRVFSTNTTPPSIADTQLSGGNIIISTTGGISYDPCYLVTTTDLQAPMDNWVCLQTNYFDLNGNGTFTVPISPTEPFRFFRLQVE